MTDLQQHHVILRDIVFAYTDQGSGPVVLEGHGVTQSHHSQHAIGFPEYQQVALDGSRLVSYDARGHGGSTGSNNPEDYSAPSLACDMLAVANHFSPDAPISVIGCSLSSKTLLYAAIAAPERFSRLVVTAPAAAWETRAAQAAQFRDWADLAASDPHGYAVMRRKATMDPHFAGPPGFPGQPDVAEGLLPTILRGVADTDMPPVQQIATITQPTLILAWAGDPSHPVSTAVRLSELIPGAELVISASHDEVARWGELASDFLNP